MVLVFAANIKEETFTDGAARDEEHAGMSARSTEQGTLSRTSLLPPGETSDVEDSDDERDTIPENNLSADYGTKRGHDPQFIGNLPPISEVDSGAESSPLRGTVFLPTPPSVVRVVPQDYTPSSSSNAGAALRPSSSKSSIGAHFIAAAFGSSQPPTSTLRSKVTQWMAAAESVSPTGTSGSQWTELARQMLGGQSSEYDVTRPVSYGGKQTTSPRFQPLSSRKEAVDGPPAFIDATLGKLDEIHTARLDSLAACHMPHATRHTQGRFNSDCIPVFQSVLFVRCNFGEDSFRRCMPHNGPFQFRLHSTFSHSVWFVRCNFGED